MIYYPTYLTIYFSLATKMSRQNSVPAGSVINWLPGSELRIRGNGLGSERNIYESAALLSKD
jgi:hypothetical protein